MIGIRFAAGQHQWPEFEPHLRAALDDAGLSYELTPDVPPERCDYVIYAPNAGEHLDFTPFTRVKLVQSLWAGAEKLLLNDTMTQPLARMVDPGLTEGMVEYVVGHVMRHHLGMDAHIVNPNRVWDPTCCPPLARNRKVAMLGLGELGAASAAALVALNFRVLGWSRRLKDIAGVACHAGEEGLDDVLRQAEIVVLLLPQTAETENTFDARRLALLPKGASIVNPGRGPLIDDDALLDALDVGQVGHATLDVFRQEPLPGAHPFWAHPRVTVTPHIAADTRADTSSRVVAANIARVEAGEPPLHLVDRATGY